MKIDSLDTLLTEELRDIYDAEKQITKALPKMAKAASSPQLRQALQEHLEVTRGQIGRIEEIFGLLDEKPKSHPCAGMKGIIEEGGEVLSEKRGSSENLSDAAIISSAQRVEHYEIAAYGTLRTYAEMLGNERVARLLEQTKQEEAEADRKLSSISEEILSEERAGLETEDEEIDMEEDEDIGKAEVSGGNGHRAARSSSSSGRKPSARGSSRKR